MNVIDAIRARRSVRRFQKGAAIPREDVEALLEAAMLAPSAVNSRPWEFYCTDSAERKAQLMAAHPASRMLETASWAIVVCGRPDLQPPPRLLAAGLRRRGGKHFAAGGGTGLRRVLVRLLPERAAHGRHPRGARLYVRARGDDRAGRARRGARPKGFLRPRTRHLPVRRRPAGAFPAPCGGHAAGPRAVSALRKRREASPRGRLLQPLPRPSLGARPRIPVVKAASLRGAGNGAVCGQKRRQMRKKPRHVPRFLFFLISERSVLPCRKRPRAGAVQRSRSGRILPEKVISKRSKVPRLSRRRSQMTALEMSLKTM